MLKVKIVLFIVTVLMVGCIRKNPKISIYNNSKKNYDSISISTFGGEPTIFRNVKTNDRLKGIINFEHTKDGDGAYTIKIYQNDSVTRQSTFSYYTNGGSLSNEFEIYIERESTKIIEK